MESAASTPAGTSIAPLAFCPRAALAVPTVNVSWAISGEAKASRSSTRAITRGIVLVTSNPLGRSPLQFVFQFPHDLGGVRLHRLGNAQQLDDIEPARAVLDLRQVRRREAEARCDFGLLQAGALARRHEHTAEDEELVCEFGFGGDAVCTAMGIPGHCG